MRCPQKKGNDILYNVGIFDLFYSHLQVSSYRDISTELVLFSYSDWHRHTVILEYLNLTRYSSSFFYLIYGVTLWGSRGNKLVILMLGSPNQNWTIRSRPKPPPP